MTTSRQKTTDILKNQIADALLELLKKKSLDKITIDELVRKADVGRATYFRYFKSKKEVISFRLMTLWDEFRQQHIAAGSYDMSDAYFTDYARCCFDFLYELRDLHSLLFNTYNEDIIFQIYLLLFTSGDHSTWQERYYSYFYAYGLFGLLKEWALSGYQEGPAEMFSFYMEYFDHQNFVYLNDPLRQPPSRS